MKKLISILIILLIFDNSLTGNEKNFTKIPIIYSKHYDITVLGLQKLHPFDSEKYGKIYKYLVKKVGIAKNRFYIPEIASEKDLLSVHSKEYLSSLKKNENVVRIAELGILSVVPNPILQNSFLKPMKYAVGGTILGCELALEYGWAINLSGGYL